MIYTIYYLLFLHSSYCFPYKGLVVVLYEPRQFLGSEPFEFSFHYCESKFNRVVLWAVSTIKYPFKAELTTDLQDFITPMTR